MSAPWKGWSLNVCTSGWMEPKRLHLGLDGALTSAPQDRWSLNVCTSGWMEPKCLHLEMDGA